MMDVKGETHGGRGGPVSLCDFLDDFTTTTTTNTTTKLPNPDPDAYSGEASDDLRLDDFIGISEVGDAANDRSSRTSSSSSSFKRHKKLRKKKQQQQPQQQASPVIVVEGVDGVERAEVKAEVEVEVEAVTLKDAGNEKGVMDWDEEDGKEEIKKNTVSDMDMDMDFTVLEVVSSHLNLEVSKQKTSLCKKGSLARRKRPTRSTVTLPPGSSDSMFQDSTDGMSRVTFPADSDGADDEDIGKETLRESSDKNGTQRKFVPQKPPAIIPGLLDLTQSKLFNQGRDKRSEDVIPTTGRFSSPWEVAGPVDSESGQASSSVLSESDVSASQTWTSDDTDGAQSTPGTTRTPAYKNPPVWLSEMKAKTTTASGRGGAGTPRTGTDQNHAAALPASSGPRPPGGGGGASSPAGASGRREGEGLGRRGVSPTTTPGSVGVKREEAERPVWMRKAQEKTSRVADRLQGRKEEQDNREKDADDVTRTSPPWAAELKRKNRPLVAVRDSPEDCPSPRAETPSKNNNNGDSREREVYTPSWVKRDQANNSTISSPQEKVKATNDSAADVRKPQGIVFHTQGTPQWKVELTEKKRRQAETASSSGGTVGTSSRRPGDSGSPSTDTSSPSSPSIPLWKQQLVQRRRSSIPAVDKAEKPSPGREGEGGRGGDGPDWLTQVAERRARLKKSGLINEAENESHC